MSGLNNYGQLGDGTTTYRADLAQVKINENTYLNNIVRIAAGASHCLALTKDGEVYAWGLGTSGQLGQNNTKNSLYAVKVLNPAGDDTLKNIIDISAGAAHSIAINKNGEAFAWGVGTNYRLGNNSTATKMLPTKILTVSNAMKVSAGSINASILRGDGEIYGTGGNTYGQNANGATSDWTNAFLMGNNANKTIYGNIIDVVSGGNHTLFLEDTGKVYVAGLGTSGELSQASTANFTTITEALVLDDDPETEAIEKKAIDNVAYISAGYAFSIVITKDGKTLEWVLMPGEINEVKFEAAKSPVIIYAIMVIVIAGIAVAIVLIINKNKNKSVVAETENKEEIKQDETNHM